MQSAPEKVNRRLNAESDRQVPISGSDRQEIEMLYADLRRSKAKLVDASGQARLAPDSLYSFLAELIGLLNDGKSAVIVRDQATLTTIEAASLLGVSRQFVVNLLEKGEIPFHLVGTHRRMYAQDLFRYKAQRDGRRHQVIRELAQAEAKEGIYGREPSSADED
jgi:excisionase family DNA binding protein